MDNPKAIYTNRINRAIDYMLANLDESPSLDELSKAACFSPFHFHRIFRAITGETVNFHANRLRLEKAARQLKYSKNPATHIALECGFSSSSTFSRSFKQYFGITPKEYRKSGMIKNSKICKEFFPIDEYIIPMSYEQLKNKFPVEIKEISQLKVAFIRVMNAYEENRVLNAFSRMVNWAKEMGLYETETIFGMSFPKDKNCYEVCLTIPKSLKLDQDLDISVMTMPGCKYAITRISGDLKIVATAWSYLFTNWLVNSRYEPEHQHALEIFLDKDNVTNWDHFELELCLPVRPLQHYKLRR